MKKTLLSLTLGCLALFTANAQEPILKVSFDANGPVLSGSAAEGRTAAASGVTTVANTKNSATPTAQIYNPERNEYIGCTMAEPNGFYYVMFDADDAIGQAFANSCTWECLVTPLYNQAQTWKDASTVTTNGTMKIFSCQQQGGWTFSKTAKDDLKFQYVSSTDGSTQLTSTTESNKAYLQTGKYYHMVATVDKDAKKVKLYLDGQLMSTGDLQDGDFLFPNISTSKEYRTKNLFFYLGADPGSGAYGHDRAENSCRANFVFANIYDHALTDDEVKALAETEEVQYYTNPKRPNDTNLLMDVVFGKNGSVTDGSDYKAELGVHGTPNIVFNPDIKRYVIDNEGTTNGANFISRVYNYDPSIIKVLGETTSYEVYAKAVNTTPTSTMSPLSGQQGGGMGFEFQATGKIQANYNVWGYRTSTSAAGNPGQSVGTAEGTLNTDFNHYVVTFDRTKLTTTIYINGVQAAIVDHSSVDDPSRIGHYYSFAPYQWWCINGDPSSHLYDTEICDYPWDGQIATARVWGKTLTAEEVAELYKQATATTSTISLNTTSTKAVALPYDAVVPEGLKAVVPTENNEGKITYTDYAVAGEVIPAKTPVIMMGGTGEYNIEAAGADADVKEAPATNLLKTSILLGEVTDAYVLSDGKFVKASGALEGLTPYMEAEGELNGSTVTVGETGWKAVALPYNAVVPENVKVYVPVAANSDEQYLVTNYAKAGEVIPANTAVIIRATAADYNFAIAEADATVKDAPAIDYMKATEIPDEVEVATSLSTEIPASNLSSIVLPFDAVIPEGVKTFTAEKIFGTKKEQDEFGMFPGVTIKETNDSLEVVDYLGAGKVLPAMTPVIIKGEQGEYTFNMADADATVEAAPATNLLQASLSITNGDNLYFQAGDLFLHSSMFILPCTPYLTADNDVSEIHIDLPKYKYNFDVVNDGGGVSVRKGEEEIETSGKLLVGTKIHVEAHPFEGIMFTGWTASSSDPLKDDGSNRIAMSYSFDLELEKDTALSANFAIFGDADQDDRTTVNDFNYVKMYALGRMNAPTNKASIAYVLADVNYDQALNVADCQYIACNINGMNYDKAKAFREAETVAQGFNVAVNGNVMNVTLDNASEFNGAQFDVMLPEGVNISNLSTDANHAIAANKLANGMTRILITSFNVANFESSEVATITLTSNADATVDNAVFADKSFNAVKAISTKVTAINGVSAAANKNGKFIQNNKVLIQKNGKKYDVDGKLAK